ncbi:hypothetical protein [Rossellomorea marisflavi]
MKLIGGWPSTMKVIFLFEGEIKGVFFKLINMIKVVEIKIDNKGV